MGLLLLLLTVFSIASLVACLYRKRKIGYKKYGTIALVLITAVLCCAFTWYVVPFKNNFPSNMVISIRYDTRNYRIDDQDISDNIKRLLKEVTVQRELVHNSGIFPSGQLVQGDAYFVIELYDSDEMISALPKHIGEYCFIINSPESARYILPSNNNRNKYRILNADSILEELTAIITSITL